MWELDVSQPYGPPRPATRTAWHTLHCVVWLWIMNGNRCGRESLWTKLYYPSINQERLRKPKQFNSRYLDVGPRFEPGTIECKHVLTTSQGGGESRRWVRVIQPGSGHVGFCDGQKWRWGTFSPRTSVFPANLHSICFSTIIFTITRGWHNRAGVAAVPIASQT
jgi:hypothetical protein